MLESNITRKIMTALRKRGVWCYKVHGGPYQQAGIPDVAGIYRGLAVYVEVKTPKGKVSKIQAVTMKQIATAGGVVGVARNVDDALDILREAEERLRCQKRMG